MTIQHTTFPFAGYDFDGFMTEDGRCWVTLSSVAKALEVSRESTNNWTRRHTQTEDTLAVKVGKKANVNATAYPTSIITDFIQYRAELGDIKAQALAYSTLQVELEDRIKRSFGIVETTAVKEAAHEAINSDRIQRYQQKLIMNGQLKGKAAEEANLELLNLAQELELSLEEQTQAKQTCYGYFEYVADRLVQPVGDWTGRDPAKEVPQGCMVYYG